MQSSYFIILFGLISATQMIGKDREHLIFKVIMFNIILLIFAFNIYEFN